MAHPYAKHSSDKAGKARVKTVLKRNFGGMVAPPDLSAGPRPPMPTTGQAPATGAPVRQMPGMLAAAQSQQPSPQAGVMPASVGPQPAQPTTSGPMFGVRTPSPAGGASPVPGRSMADLQSGMRAAAAAQRSSPAPTMGGMPQRVAPTANPYSGGRGFQPGWLQTMMRMRGGQ